MKFEELTKDEATLLLGVLHLACETTVNSDPATYERLFNLRQRVWRIDNDSDACKISRRLYEMIRESV